jgi:uncharacterized protein YbbC (DUF1343 family)
MQSMVRTGLDHLAESEFRELEGRSIGILCNQSSLTRNLGHVLDLLVDRVRRGQLKVAAVFGPEHGLHGHTQDNMIEWEGALDSRTGFRVHSLYGQYREPQPEMLSGIDLFLVDIPDVGSRYYTFIWSMALCMKACERAGIPMLVLDRPNPIGGHRVEGPMLDPALASFVGLYPLPVRHGMTVAEIARYLQSTEFPNLKLSVGPMDGWHRRQWYDETGLPWAMPSPNMPTLDTATVYPGGCLFEATNLSEGRGTTRPFEILGAPFVDGWRLADELNRLRLSGIRFRPIEFEPTFNKFAKERCGGVFLHVLDRESFEPVLTAVAILQTVRALYGSQLEWRSGPYEYEQIHRPIDILAGNRWLATAIDDLRPLDEIREQMRAECEPFLEIRQSCRIYP